MSLTTFRHHKCRLCKNFLTGVTEYGGEQVDGDPILFESENFFVLPDLSPVASFHLLVVSKEHCHSMATLPHDIIDELDLIIDMLCCKLKEKLGCSLAIFEHGTLGQSVGTLNSINHFHLHIVQFDGKLSETVEKNALCEKVGIEELSSLSRAAVKEYIFVQDNDGKRYVFLFDKENIRSQLARKLIYDKCLKKQAKQTSATYNWKKGIDVLRYNASAEVLKEVFNKKG